MTEPIDISLPIGPELMTWPGTRRVEIRPLQRLAEGDGADVSELRLSYARRYACRPTASHDRRGARASTMSRSMC